jgi:alpha-tubulin suppressor-like RCC1 family protein
MTALDRRQALTLLAALPLAVRTTARAQTQTRATAKHRVFLGAGHGLLLEPGGTLQAWHTGRQLGDTAVDALGLGDNRPLRRYTLAAVPGLTDVVAVAAGSGCSFAVRRNWQLLAWGLNAGNGLLGTTPQSFVETRASWAPNSNVPVPLAVAFDAVDVVAGDSHVLALTRDGRVFAWGRGDKGQLGVGPMPIIQFKTRTPAAMPYMAYPLPVPGLTEVAAVSAGRTHSLALMKDGTVRAWGENRWGELGDGTTITRNAPVPVAGLRGAVAVAAGSGFSLAVLGDGTVMSWGNGFAGELGRGPAAGNRADPLAAPVPGVRDVRAVAAGLANVLALTADARVVSWGQDGFGALGRGGGPAPAPIPSLAGVRSITAAGATSVAVLGTGRIVTWGDVRPWTRPPEEGSYDNFSHRPILLWLDGLEQP